MQDNHISDPRTRRFVAALRQFEQDADPAELLRQFAPDATVSRLDARGERTDLAEFWQEYRRSFEKLSTTFVDAVEATTRSRSSGRRRRRCRAASRSSTAA